MNSKTRDKVITPDSETDWFDIIGVLQLDTLAPMLYIPREINL